VRVKAQRAVLKGSTLLALEGPEFCLC